MSFERPTLSTLITRAVGDIQTRLVGADALLRRSFENVMARVIAGAAHGLHGHLFFLSRQIFPDTAESKFMRRWAGVWGVNPIDPAPATGNITITGTATTAVPAGTAFARTDGAEFTTDALLAIGGAGSVIAAVTASDSGADGNTDASTVLTIVTPIVNVDSTAVVDGSGLENGLDAETDAALLVRLLLRIQTPPSGGGPNDYVKWALEVAGVTRVWEYPAELGLGTVSVRFMTDIATVDGIPTAGKVTEVQAYLDAKAPLTAVITVVAPIAVALNPNITLVPNADSDVEAAVTTELEAMLLRSAEPGATLLLSHINEAISLAEGETDHTTNSPVANVTHTTGQIPTLGTPVYP